MVAHGKGDEDFLIHINKFPKPHEKGITRFMRQRNVLLVDMPTYTVSISAPYRDILRRRLKAENVSREKKVGFPLRRPGLSYSRGLLLVAKHVERKGHKVKYLIYPDPHDATQFAELAKQADIVGITATTPAVQQA